MENILSHHLLKVIAGTTSGAAIGYLYYRFIGCASGSCPITSNKHISTIYGAILGLLFTL
ncbi:MAG: DUF6132 family protein [Bacteroidota bacterium]|nr:DUF6132 family protein [Bacteroidota bacterium]